MVEPEEVQYMDVSPKQSFSVRRRSSRSWRMTTQTVPSWVRTCSARRCPCSGPEAPLIGTGMEQRRREGIRGSSLSAKHDGIIESVDANRIMVT